MGQFTDIQATFGDIHKGKLGFLIGGGMSAFSVDPKELKPYVTMVLNEAIFKFDDTTYFFSCDGAAFHAGLLRRLAELNHATKAIIPSHKTPAEPGPMPPERFFCVQRKEGIVKQAFTNKDDRLVFGTSSAHPAAHLLQIMGCDPIVLLGCDCLIKEGAYAFWHLPPYCDNMTSFYQTTFGKDIKTNYDRISQQRGSAPLDAMLGTHHDYWMHMASITPKIPIVDASEGRLECFPRMKLKEVLKTYGDRKINEPSSPC
jgi:hypothetical protein